MHWVSEPSSPSWPFGLSHFISQSLLFLTYKIGTNNPGSQSSCVFVPRAAITTHPKLSGCKQETFIGSQFWRPEVGN